MSERMPVGKPERRAAARRPEKGGKKIRGRGLSDFETELHEVTARSAETPTTDDVGTEMRVRSGKTARKRETEPKSTTLRKGEAVTLEEISLADRANSAEPSSDSAEPAPGVSAQSPREAAEAAWNALLRSSGPMPTKKNIDDPIEIQDHWLTPIGNDQPTINDLVRLDALPDPSAVGREAEEFDLLGELEKQEEFDFNLVRRGIESAFHTATALRVYVQKARQTKDPLQIVLPSKPPETFEKAGATAAEAQRFVDEILPELDAEIKARTKKAIRSEIANIEGRFMVTLQSQDSPAVELDKAIVADKHFHDAIINLHKQIDAKDTTVKFPDGKTPLEADLTQWSAMKELIDGLQKKLEDRTQRRQEQALTNAINEILDEFSATGNVTLEEANASLKAYIKKLALTSTLPTTTKTLPEAHIDSKNQLGELKRRLQAELDIREQEVAENKSREARDAATEKSTRDAAVIWHAKATILGQYHILPQTQHAALLENLALYIAYLKKQDVRSDAILLPDNTLLKHQNIKDEAQLQKLIGELESELTRQRRAIDLTREEAAHLEQTRNALTIKGGLQKLASRQRQGVQDYAEKIGKKEATNTEITQLKQELGKLQISLTQKRKELSKNLGLGLIARLKLFLGRTADEDVIKLQRNKNQRGSPRAPTKKTA